MHPAYLFDISGKARYHEGMTKYILDEEVFKKRLIELGFRSLSDFASKSLIHRNTLLQLIHGKNVFSHAFFRVASALEINPLKLLRSSPHLRSDIDHIEEIHPIIAWLREQDKDLAIFLLGSRARKSARDYSDWDIGLFRYPKALSGREYLKMKMEVGELSEDLIRSVDLVNFNQAPSWFLEGLGAEEVLFLDGNLKAFIYFTGVLDGIHQAKVA